MLMEHIIKSTCDENVNPLTFGVLQAKELSSDPIIFPCMETQGQTMYISSYAMYQCCHHLYAK